MLLIFGNYIHAWLLLLGLLSVVSEEVLLYEGDPCELRNKSSGICIAFSKCLILVEKVRSQQISLKEPVHCGYTTKEELICCPVNEPTPNIGTTTATTTTTTTTTPPKPKQPSGPDVRYQRVSVAACKIIEESLSPELTPQILNGDAVEPGEYPHMAAIGYPVIGSQADGYEIRCGGTLIHERFVLTAAHCVSGKAEPPTIVRLGISNFDDPAEFPNRVEIPIWKIHIHQKYMGIQKMNDIALIELERPIQKTRFIAPTCIGTNEASPTTDDKLFIAGWGQYNSSIGHIMSRKLFKASVSMVEETSCRASLSILKYQLRASQLCAADERYMQKRDDQRDSCEGDSGGPLIRVKDEVIKSYEVVGIIAFGSSCANTIPGVYTKVSDYLDFIESIVWPSGSL